MGRNVRMVDHADIDDNISNKVSKLIDSDLLLSKSLGRMKQLYTTRKGRVLIEQKKS